MKSKYTESMLKAITAMAEEHGELNLALCHEIAATPEFSDADISPRGVIAKARSMGLPYARKVRLTKAGKPVMRKNAIVIAIEHKLGVQGLEMLAKADKQTLETLLDAI